MTVDPLTAARAVGVVAEAKVCRAVELDFDDEVGVSGTSLEKVGFGRPRGEVVFQGTGEGDLRQGLAGVVVHQCVGREAGVRLLREAADVD